MDRPNPKKKTLDKWTNLQEWLKVKNGKSVCSICTKYKKKPSRFSAATNAFTNGSDNYRRQLRKIIASVKYTSKLVQKMKYKQEKKVE